MAFEPLAFGVADHHLERLAAPLLPDLAFQLLALSLEEPDHDALAGIR